MPEVSSGLAQPGLAIDPEELVKLCAVDTELFGTAFFPRTFRQGSPSFSRPMFDAMDDPLIRQLNINAFRGSAKTSRARIFMAKRISYAISRTVLYIGVSESKAIESVNWLRNRVERNPIWRDTFGLKPGKKWEETQLELIHTKYTEDGRPRTSEAQTPFTIRVLASGVTGSLRGLNIDDYRPDLIIVDDPQNDETAATQTQREKLEDLILGAVLNSLTPKVDEPNAKMLMLVTPQHNEDVSQKALKSSSWTSLVYPCWTQETMDLPVHQQISSWEGRFPTTELRQAKVNAVNDNKLSIFTREMECRLVSRETAQFRSNWLNVRQLQNSAPRGYPAILGIDPVPPPSDRQLAQGLQKKDFEAHYVWCRKGDEYHLCDFDRSRGHDPSWTIATAFRLARQWRVLRIVFDAVAYQRSLKWLFEQEMKKTGIWYSMVPVADGMKKFSRIGNIMGSLGAGGNLHIGPEHSIFMEQYNAFGPTYSGLDDDLDASTLALQELYMPNIQVDLSGTPLMASQVEEVDWAGSCP